MRVNIIKTYYTYYTVIDYCYIPSSLHNICDMHILIYDGNNSIV